MRTKVIYSPQPDEPPESSAALEYAKRISTMTGGGGDDPSGSGDGSSSTVAAEPLTLESFDFLLPKQQQQQEGFNYIVIVSCSADGSVDRKVRRLVRSLKDICSNASTSTSTSTSTSSSNDMSATDRPKVAIALLGHARCENSANQMKDTIFGNGRKLRKAVVGVVEACGDSSRDGTTATATANVNDDLVPTLEVQVELEGPDAAGGFDEWVKQVIE